MEEPDPVEQILAEAAVQVQLMEQEQTASVTPFSRSDRANAARLDTDSSNYSGTTSNHPDLVRACTS